MSESKELTLPERAAVALGAAEHEKVLVELSKKYSDIVEIKNPAGREQAHAAYMTLKNARIAIEKAGKDARDDATKFSKAVISEVDRLTAITADEERRLQNLRDTFDAEREAERLEKLAAEQQRIAAIRQKIDAMRNRPAEMVGRPSDEISAVADVLSETVIALDDWQEFTGEAISERNHAVTKLREMQQAQATHEAEYARLKAEREEMELRRLQLAAQERKAAEARAEQEAKDRAERQRAEDEQRIAKSKAEAAMLAERQAHEARLRAEREAAEAEMRRQREAEEQRLAAQRAELARQQAAIDAANAERDRVAREAREAEAAARRLEADHSEALEENARIDAAAELLRQQAVETRMLREQQDRERAETLAARYAPEPTGGTWSIGKTWGSIVTTAEIAGSPGTGHNDVEYYGGNLICESVWRPADACVLAAAHDMLDLLKELIDIEGPQPGNNEWAAKVKAVLTKATYVSEVQPEAQAA